MNNNDAPCFKGIFFALVPSYREIPFFQPGVVARICNPAVSVSEIWSAVGSVPVMGNSPSIVG